MFLRRTRESFSVSYNIVFFLTQPPQGGLLTWKLATECSEFVNSFVLDSDIVPRLSVNNMERCVSKVSFAYHVVATSSDIMSLLWNMVFAAPSYLQSPR